MARTKQTARKSTGGRAPMVQLCCGGLRRHPWLTPEPPGRMGSWTRNDVGRRRMPPHATLDPKDTSVGNKYMIIVPNHYAKFLPEPNDEGVLKDRADNDGTKYGPSAGDILTTLPPELLLRIFSLLIRTGAIYHFTPTKTSSGESAVSVHYVTNSLCFGELICNSWHNDKQSNAPQLPHVGTPWPLAAICKSIQDIVYDIFYSGNQFDVDLAASGTALTSYVCMEQDMHKILLHPNEDTKYTSWSRLHRPISNAIGICGLLTRNTLRHVTNLTISVNATTRMMPEEEWRDLDQQIQLITSYLSKGTALRRLNVGFGHLTHHRDRLISQVLQLRDDGSPHSLHMVLLDTAMDSQRDSGRRGSKLDNSVDYLLSPLRDIVVSKRIKHTDVVEDINVEDDGGRSPIDYISSFTKCGAKEGLCWYPVSSSAPRPRTIWHSNTGGRCGPRPGMH